MRIFGITIKKTDTSIYILSNKPIQKGDFVLAISDYPHWTNFPQQCTMTGFDNGDIGLRESVRVSGKCFRKIIWDFYKAGIRMLTQEPWNMITTFIIAQNNVLSTHIEEW